MHNHPKVSFFFPVQSFVMTHQMKYCIDPSLDHHHGGQPLLSHWGLVLILEVVETVGRSPINLAWYRCLGLVAPVPIPSLLLQQSAQSVEQVPEPTPSHPLLHSSATLTPQPIYLQFSLSLCLAFPPNHIYSSLPFLSSLIYALVSTSFLFLVNFSLHPPTLSSLSSFVRLSFCIVTSSHLFPKLLSQQDDLLWTCRFSQPLQSR